MGIEEARKTGVCGCVRVCVCVCVCVCVLQKILGSLFSPIMGILWVRLKLSNLEVNPFTCTVILKAWDEIIVFILHFYLWQKEVSNQSQYVLVKHSTTVLKPQWH